MAISVQPCMECVKNVQGRTATPNDVAHNLLTYNFKLNEKTMVNYTDKSERLIEWAQEKKTEDLVSTALKEYANFCKKLNGPQLYLACKQEIIERLKANETDEKTGREKSELMRLVSLLKQRAQEQQKTAKRCMNDSIKPEESAFFNGQQQAFEEVLRWINQEAN